MRNTEAARYARWSAGAALLLALAVGGVFARRAWQAQKAQREAPPKVPPSVHQRSAEFTFSKVEKERTLFTVRASRATQFNEGNRNLLEDVWITIYGRAGLRNDNIHTQSCEYHSDSGQIVCAGEVQIDLESAEEARLHPAPAGGVNSAARMIRVGTRGVSFNRESGEARTDQPVTFRFPQGQGRAVGISYSSQSGMVRLLRDVELTLEPPAAPTRARHGESQQATAARPSITVSGNRLEYGHDTRLLRLEGDAHARQGNRELLAGELLLELDAELRAKRLVARPEGTGAGHQPELRSAEPRGQAVLVAGEFVALLAPQGWAQRVQASGGVRGDLRGPSEQDHLEAQQLEVEMEPRLNQPRLLTVTGDVKAQMQKGAASRRLETSALRLNFTAGSKPGLRWLNHAETLAPATLEWSAPGTAGPAGGAETTRLRGQQLAAEFGPRNQLTVLTGHDGTEVERRLPGRPPQVSASREFTAKLGRGGDWTELNESGNVRLREGDRTAQADRASLVRATDQITLTGSAVIADATTRTTAQAVTFNQRTGEVRAEGSVRSVELSAGRTGVTNLAPQPANLSSDRLAANSASGRAVYSGHARLWQGDSVIEADSIELLRDAHQLNARGNVAAVFPQAAGSPPAPFGNPRPAGPASSAPAGPDLWRVRAGTLTYWGGESRAHLEQNVSAQSRQGQINSRVLELFFAPGAAAPTAGQPAAAASGSAQQLTRAVATGGVSVREGDRRGTSERADYTAAEEKFVLSGGRPTLYDAFRGTTTGRQLTFYFADDTIVVDSEEGSRTLTRHRVEK